MIMIPDISQHVHDNLPSMGGTQPGDAYQQAEVKNGSLDVRQLPKAKYFQAPLHGCIDWSEEPQAARRMMDACHNFPTRGLSVGQMFDRGFYASL